MKIIFLDVDGVLNSSETYDEWVLKGEKGYGGFFQENEKATDKKVKWGQKLVDNLKRIVDETGAKIVVSSAWRMYFSVPKFREMFEVYGWKDAPIIDKTPSGYRIRGQEVERWIANYEKVGKLTSYVILDDFDDFKREQYPFFVNTNPELGLTSEDADKAIFILNNPPKYE